MTRREAERLTHQADTLRALGFTYDEAEALRRISMTLQRWFELECGNSNDYGSWAIERGDDPAGPEGNGDGVPYMVHHHYRHGAGKDTTTRTKIADREGGARRRLAAIVAARNSRQVVHTACKTCGQDVEASYPFTCWLDRGGNNSCGSGGILAHSASGNSLVTYIQTDPRGAALYLIRPGDVPDGGEVEAYYSRGVCVY